MDLELAKETSRREQLGAGKTSQAAPHRNLRLFRPSRSGHCRRHRQEAGFQYPKARWALLAQPSARILPFADETGGLSGAPLTKRSTQIVQHLNHRLQRKIPIIAAGGVMSVADAQEKLEAGASLVQIYTGLIYKGPALVKKIVNGPSP